MSSSCYISWMNDLMIVKYSWLQVKRFATTSKVLFIHIILIIPGMGYVILLMQEELNIEVELELSIIVFYIFLFQTLFILGKRLKNEFFFSSNCYQIFPQKRSKIYLYTLILSVIDFQVIVFLLISTGMILLVTNWSVSINLLFLFIFIISEIIYLTSLMILIEVMTSRYGNSKNLFTVSIYIPFFLGQTTLLSEQLHIFAYYPISGWIASTVLAAIEENYLSAILYFILSILASILGLYLLNRLSFPKKYNV